MAKITINPSQMKVNPGRQTNLTQLGINPDLFTRLGNEISQSGKVFEKIKADQRLIEDQNRSWEIISEKKKEIDLALGQTSKLFNMEEADTILDGAYEIDVSKERKDVQRLVNTYLVKDKIKSRSKVYSTVLANTAQQTEDNDNDFLIDNFQKRISPDAVDRATADKDYESWFNNPINKAKRDIKGHNKLKEKFDVLYIEAVNKLEIESNPFAALLDPDEIKKKFGEQKGELYLAKARNQVMRELDAMLLLEDKVIKEREFKQITLFSELANRAANPSDEVPAPTFLELEDLKDNGSINFAQYGALVNLLMDDDKTSDGELINIINNQLVIAENNNELEDIQSVASSTQEFLENVNVKDITVINKLIDTFKKDPTKHEDYKKLYDVLRANLNDLGGALDVLAGSGGITPADKIETTDALARFNSYVANGLPPENAYVKVISTITIEKIPDVYSPNLKPLYTNIDDIKTALQKNPDNYFNTKIGEVAQKLSKGEITPDDFFEDVERIDMLRNVYNVRVNVFGKDKALEPKTTDELNLIELLQSVKDKVQTN